MAWQCRPDFVTLHITHCQPQAFYRASYKALHNLAHSALTSCFFHFTPQPLWPLCKSYNTPGKFLPQGLCIYSSLPVIHSASCLHNSPETCFRSWVKYRLLRVSLLILLTIATSLQKFSISTPCFMFLYRHYYHVIYYTFYLFYFCLSPLTRI